MVSEALLDRAMKLMDALLAACEGERWKVQAGEKREYDDKMFAATNILVREDTVSIALFENVRRAETTGLLRFEIVDRCILGAHIWADGKGRRLEDNLPQVLAGVSAASDQLRVRRLEALERKRQSQEQERLRKEAMARQKAEAERVADLESQAKGLINAAEIRALIVALQAGAANLPEAERLRIERWSEWAEALARRHDPLTNGYVERVLAWIPEQPSRQ